VISYYLRVPKIPNPDLSLLWCMRVFYLLFVLFHLVTVFFSCQPKAASTNAALTKRAAAIATAYCKCTDDLIALNHQMAQVGTDTATTNQLFKAIGSAYTRAEACTDSILMLHGHLSPQLLELVQQTVNTQCPDVAAHPDMLRELLGK
jgi:hypothetical protein